MLAECGTTAPPAPPCLTEVRAPAAIAGSAHGDQGPRYLGNQRQKSLFYRARSDLQSRIEGEARRVGGVDSSRTATAGDWRSGHGPPRIVLSAIRTSARPPTSLRVARRLAAPRPHPYPCATTSAPPPCDPGPGSPAPRPVPPPWPRLRGHPTLANSAGLPSQAPSTPRPLTPSLARSSPGLISSASRVATPHKLRPNTWAAPPIHCHCPTPRARPPPGRPCAAFLKGVFQNIILSRAGESRHLRASTSSSGLLPEDNCPQQNFPPETE